MDKIILNETWLATGLRGVTSLVAGGCAEAAAVCWEKNGHGEELEVILDGDQGGLIPVVRRNVTEQMRNAHADLQDAVESGACAVAFMLVIEKTSYTVIQRSWKRTGFDYWLGDKSATLFQQTARLEVSGILAGDDKAITKRVKEKMSRFQKYPSSLPAVVVVAEFNQPKARMVQS